jgi:hypothetical protein
MVMADAGEQEIRELHAFIRAWFRGEVKKSETAFARMAGVVADGFVLVATSGHAIEREPLLRGFFERHGAIPSYKFRIEDVRLRQRHGDVAIYTYQIEESDDARGRQTVMVSIVFREDDAMPNGLEHLLVHETAVQK